MCIITVPLVNTVNVEGFAGLNFHRFKPNKVFAEKLLQCLMFKVILFKQHHYMNLVYIHGKTFTVLFKTAKTVKFSPVNLSTFTVWYTYL